MSPKKLLTILASFLVLTTSMAVADPIAEAFRPRPDGRLSEMPSIAGIEAVRVDFELAPVLNAAPQINVVLLDGVARLATRVGGENRGKGNAYWHGELEGGGQVSLTAAHGYLVGAVFTSSGTYELMTLAGGEVALVELDSSKFPPCAGELTALERAAGTGNGSIGLASSFIGPALKDTRGAVASMDVMIVFTSLAASGAGGPAAMMATAQAAVDISNTAFTNSSVDASFRLVHASQTTYNDSSNLTTDLFWLDDDANVAAKRDRYGADMVGLITEIGSGCGVGYVMRTPGPGFESSAFQVTRRNCAVGNLTYAHEHGHNMGCEHDPANGTTPGNASFPWSFGHFVDGSYRTVMSYSNQCTAGCTRMPFWSNPDVSNLGAPTGIADQRDNHRSINSTSLVVEDFRAALDFVFSNGFEDGGPAGWSTTVN